MDTTSQTISVHIAKAAASYFGMVFAAGLLLGTIRVPFVVPRLGVRYAELAEMPFMLAAIFVSARFILRRFALPSVPGILLFVGTLALGFLIVAELLAAYQLQGQTPGGYVTSRDPVSGSVYLAMLALFASMPLIVARRADNSLERNRDG